MAIFNSYVKLLEGTSIHKSRNPEIGWSTGMLVIWALRMVDKLRCCCKIQAQAELDGKMWSGGKSDGNPHDFLPDLSAWLMNTCFCMSSALINCINLLYPRNICLGSVCLLTAQQLAPGIQCGDPIDGTLFFDVWLEHEIEHYGPHGSSIFYKPHNYIPSGYLT